MPSGITNCLRIPPSPHLFINGSDLSFGSSVNFACEKGYTLQGPDNVICMNNGQWRGTIPHCMPTGVQCGNLTLPAHLTKNTSATASGTVVTFSCTDGYQLQGSSSLVCGSDGQWSPSLPTCVMPPNQCSTVSIGKHVHVKNSSREFGSTLKFSCDTDYRLVGSETVTCLTSGNWSAPFPLCDLIKCSTISPIEHGKWNGSSSNVGSKLTVTCDDGYTLHGKPSITCLQTGNWSAGFPSCILACTVSECQEITCDRHATCHGNTTIGSNVTVSCNDGYKLRGHGTLTCQKTGNWSAPFPLCDLITCSAMKIEHGKLNGSDTAVGTKVTVTCDDGYTLKGQGSMTCMKTGSWSDTSPSCVSADAQQNNGGGSMLIFVRREG